MRNTILAALLLLTVVACDRRHEVIDGGSLGGIPPHGFIEFNVAGTWTGAYHFTDRFGASHVFTVVMVVDRNLGGTITVGGRTMEIFGGVARPDHIWGNGSAKPSDAFPSNLSVYFLGEVINDKTIKFTEIRHDDGNGVNGGGIDEAGFGTITRP